MLLWLYRGKVQQPSVEKCRGRIYLVIVVPSMDGRGCTCVCLHDFGCFRPGFVASIDLVYLCMPFRVNASRLGCCHASLLPLCPVQTDGQQQPVSQMYLNILFFTLRFIDTGWPSSISTPASPPSPARPVIFCRSSSSSCAMVFFGWAWLSFS